MAAEAAAKVAAEVQAAITGNVDVILASVGILTNIVTTMVVVVAAVVLVALAVEEMDIIMTSVTTIG